MYKTIEEAKEIFRTIRPEATFAIREKISGEEKTGTAAELVEWIVRAKDPVSHCPVDEENVQAWTIIEVAYLLPSIS
jgi:hypothetical protein